jgi:hypothetical protein
MSDSQFGVAELSAFLIFTAGAPDVFSWQIGMRIQSLQVATVAPGVRCWRVHVDPIIDSGPYPGVAAATFLATSPAFAAFDARVLIGTAGPHAVDVYLVNTTTGLPTDPGVVQALSPGDNFGVQIHAVTAGGSGGSAP